MVQNQYQLKAISTNATTAVVAGSTNLTVHTVVCPIATTGAITFRDTAGSPATYFVLPIGSIGTYWLDCSLANGLTVVTAASDTVLISYQTP